MSARIAPTGYSLSAKIYHLQARKENAKKGDGRKIPLFPIRRYWMVTKERSAQESSGTFHLFVQLGGYLGDLRGKIHIEHSIDLDIVFFQF